MRLNSCFYLKQNSDQSGALIMLQMRWANQTLAYSTKRSLSKVEKLHWKSQRIENVPATRGKLELLNRWFDLLESEAQKAWFKEQATGMPSVAAIRAHLDTIAGTEGVRRGVAFKPAIGAQVKPKEGKETLYTLLERFATNQIDGKASVNTMKAYRKLKNSIAEFDKGKPTDFAGITLDWWTAYSAFRQSEKKSITGKTLKGVSNNSLIPELANLKAVMHFAIDEKYTDNAEVDRARFTTDARKPTDTVYLKESELQKLHATTFEDPELEIIKNLYALHCTTAMRHCDWGKVNLKHIKEIDGDFWLTYTPQKTERMNTECQVRCNDIFKEIFFQKYNGHMPAIPKDYALRKGIREVCKAIGVARYMDCELHTTRRTTITHLYKSGMPVKEIMRISGHVTETSFNAYLRMDAADSRIAQQNHAKRFVKE
jgi:integrase